MPTGVYKRKPEDNSRRGRKGHIGYMLGKHQTDETKRKISIGNKGKVVSPESRLKMSISKRNYRPTKQTIEKIKIARAKQIMPKRTEESKDKMRNEKNPEWKGDDASYIAKHEWVNNRLGKPHYCEHCKRSDLKHRQYNWANISGEYKRIISDWIRLCAKCHKKYDKNNSLRG